MMCLHDVVWSALKARHIYRESNYFNCLCLGLVVIIVLGRGQGGVESNSSEEKTKLVLMW